MVPQRFKARISLRRRLFWALVANYSEKRVAPKIGPTTAEYDIFASSQMGFAVYRTSDGWLYKVDGSSLSTDEQFKVANARNLLMSRTTEDLLAYIEGIRRAFDDQ